MCSSHVAGTLVVVSVAGQGWRNVFGVNALRSTRIGVWFGMFMAGLERPLRGATHVGRARGGLISRISRVSGAVNCGVRCVRIRLVRVFDTRAEDGA